MLISLCRAAALRYPRLTEIFLSSRFALARRAVYAFVPALREAVAAKNFSAGRFDLARSELRSHDKHGPTARRLLEVQSVLEGAGTEDPPRQLQPTGDRLKAVHAVDPLAARASGYGRRTRLILSALEQAEISNLVLSRPRWAGIEPQRSDPLGATLSGVKPLDLPVAPLSDSLTPERDYIADYAAMIAGQAVHFHAGVVHAHSDYRNGIAAAWAARGAGRRSIYEIRGMWHLTRASLEPDFASTALFRYQNHMEITAMRLCDRVVVPSRPLREWAIEAGIHPEKIAIVPAAVDTNEVLPLPPDQALVERLGLRDRFIIGFVGSITAYEGLDTVVRAAAECAAKGTELALVLVGDGPELLRLQALAAELGLGDRLVPTGQVPHRDVGAYYSVFDVCVIARKATPVSALVTPIKPAEAMAAGKPLVVTSLPPLLEFGEQGVSRLTVEPDDVSALATELRRLAVDANLRDQLGQEARGWVCRYRSLSAAASAYRSLYEELAQR